MFWRKKKAKVVECNSYPVVTDIRIYFRGRPDPLEFKNAKNSGLFDSRTNGLQIHFVDGSMKIVNLDGYTIIEATPYREYKPESVSD